MDVVAILILGLVLSFIPCKYTKELEILVPIVELEERLNPSFHKDSHAFRRYLDEFGIS